MDETYEEEIIKDHRYKIHLLQEEQRNLQLRIEEYQRAIDKVVSYLVRIEQLKTTIKLDDKHGE